MIIPSQSIKLQNYGKILKEYPDLLILINKIGIIIHSAVVPRLHKRVIFKDNSVKETAFYLRSFILEMRKTQSQHIRSDALITEQNIAPSENLGFFRGLYSNSNSFPGNEPIESLVQSVSGDVVFATTQGRIKPSKH